MYLDGEWTLACLLCDSRDDDRDGALTDLDGPESEGIEANGPTDTESVSYLSSILEGIEVVISRFRGIKVWAHKSGKRKPRTLFELF
jgi:hypothetical protein